MPMSVLSVLEQASAESTDWQKCTTKYGGDVFLMARVRLILN